MNIEAIVNFLSTQGADFGLKLLGALAAWIVGRWLIGLVLRAVGAVVDRLDDALEALDRGDRLAELHVRDAREELGLHVVLALLVDLLEEADGLLVVAVAVLVAAEQVVELDDFALARIERTQRLQAFFQRGGVAGFFRIGGFVRGRQRDVDESAAAAIA